jgi:putative pyruvate formate lyase activating enzyme
VFCQNFDISWLGSGREVTPVELAEVMLRLQDQGCHNINLVTPEHVVPQVLEALPLAIEKGLQVPIVYNTSAYDSLESLRLLDGIVDIYMPDFKIWCPDTARRLLLAADYPSAAREAFREMHRQVGDLVIDADGLAVRGLLVRHLVMPGLLDDTRLIMRFLATQISSNTYVNVMAQYHPAGRVGVRGRYQEINRRVTAGEVAEAHAIAREEGLSRLDARADRSWWQ